MSDESRLLAVTRDGKLAVTERGGVAEVSLVGPGGVRNVMPMELGDVLLFCRNLLRMAGKPADSGRPRRDVAADARAMLGPHEPRPYNPRSPFDPN